MPKMQESKPLGSPSKVSLSRNAKQSHGSQTGRDLRVVCLEPLHQKVGQCAPAAGILKGFCCPSLYFCLGVDCSVIAVTLQAQGKDQLLNYIVQLNSQQPSRDPHLVMPIVEPKPDACRLSTGLISYCSFYHWTSEISNESHLSSPFSPKDFSS